jgi:hypothetical protein
VLFRKLRQRISKSPLGTKDIAMLFESNKRTVRKNLLPGPQQQGPLGRHTAFNPEVESSLVRMLLDPFHEEKAITQKEFLRIMKEQRKATLTKAWVRHFIGRYLDDLKVCRSLTTRTCEWQYQEHSWNSTSSSRKPILLAKSLSSCLIWMNSLPPIWRIETRTK